MQQRCIAAPFRGNASGVQQRRRLPSQPGSKLQPSALPGAFRTHNLSSSKPARGNLARAGPPGSGSFQGSVLVLLQAAMVALDKARDAYLADPANQRLWEMYQDANHGLQKLLDTYQDLQAKSSGPRQEPVAAVSTGATNVTAPADKGSLLLEALNIAEADGTAGAWRMSPAKHSPYSMAALSSDTQPGGLYVDPSGAVPFIKDWAERVVTELSEAQVNRRTFPAVLIVSGLTKTGKSFTVNSLIPAILADTIQQRGDAAAPLLKRFALLRLDASLLARQGGGTSGLMRSLLRHLLRWLVTTRVPVRQDAFDQAKHVLDTTPVQPSSLEAFSLEVIELMRAVEVPVLMLLDEAQSLSLATLDDGRPDQEGTKYIRDTVLKRLLVYGPPSILWCITGSSMALTWLNIADMAPNGYMLFTGAARLHLPATFPKEHMQAVCRELQHAHSQHVPLLQQLFEVAEPTPALMTALVEEWFRMMCPTDISSFASQYVQSKLVQEARREWASTFTYLDVKQRMMLRDLALPWVGVPTSHVMLSGLDALLRPHLTTADGRTMYLKSAHHRQIIKLVIAADGTLVEGIEGVQLSASLTQVEGADMLMVLGETADYLFSVRKPPRSAHMLAQKAKFRSFLEELLVDPLCRRAQWQAWPEQAWFASVLASRWNSTDREWLADTKNRAKLRSPFDMLVFYLRLSRNVLAHRKAGMEDVKAVTRDTVMALPSFLEVDVHSLLEGLARALGLLDQATVRAAAAAMEQQDKEAET